MNNPLGRIKQWKRDHEIWYMECKKPELVRFNYNRQGIKNI